MTSGGGSHKFGPKVAKGYKGLRQIEGADFLDKKRLKNDINFQNL
jgi:hypothetical protein